jgi:hypothetical protein
MKRIYPAILQTICVFAATCAPVFPAINLVDSPRVLLIAPSPIAAQPGEVLSAQAVFAGGAVNVRLWRVCVPVKIDPAPEQRCVDGQGLVAYTQMSGQSLQWTVTSDENELGRFVVGANIDASGNIPQPTRLFTDVQNNGLDLLLYVEGEANGVVVRGFKRALLIIRPLRVPDVQVPTFQFGEQIVRPSDNHECLRADSPEREIVVTRSSTVAPLPILAPMTTLQDTLSHYANGGNFLQRPDRPDIGPWVAPASPAIVEHWLVAQRNVSRAQGDRVSVINWCHFRVSVQ